MENFPFHMFNITGNHGRSATIMLIHKYLLKVSQEWVKKWKGQVSKKNYSTISQNKLNATWGYALILQYFHATEYCTITIYNTVNTKFIDIFKNTIFLGP